MSQTIRAHYDGKVIVPEEPVDFPVDQPLFVELRPAPGINESPGDATIRERLERLRAVTGVVREITLPEEALWRENPYDERV